MGSKLGTLFARAGHEVTFSYSHSEQKLERLARQAGHGARAGTPAEAAQADAILLAIPWSRLVDVLSQTGDLSGKVIISCTLPMDEENDELIIANDSSGAEELARIMPAARVVAAFGTVPSECLFGVYAARKRKKRPSLVYCGDDKGAKKVAAQLIKDVGFDPVDAGGLAMARFTEPFTLLVAKLAYEGRKGPELAYRFEWFKDG